MIRIQIQEHEGRMQIGAQGSDDATQIAVIMIEAAKQFLLKANEAKKDAKPGIVIANAIPRFNGAPPER